MEGEGRRRGKTNQVQESLETEMQRREDEEGEGGKAGRCEGVNDQLI